MEKFRPPFKPNRFSRTFSTTNIHYGDNNVYFEKKKEIETINKLSQEKQLSSDELLDMLKKNKQDITDNMYSAELSGKEADALYKKAAQAYRTNEDRLSAEERAVIDKHLAANTSGYERSSINSSDEESSLFDISKKQNRLLNAMFIIKSIDESLSARGDSRATASKNKILDESKNLMQEFASLADNITTGVGKNDSIRDELKNRNVSLYPDYLDTYTDVHGPSFGDVD